MGDDLKALDEAEWTFCIERQNGYRDDYGHGRTPVRVLPWVFVRLNSDGASRDYVMPLPAQANVMGSGVHSALKDIKFGTEVDRALYYRYGRAFIEYMPNKPFPLESAEAARSNGDPGGEIAIHFFGGI